MAVNDECRQPFSEGRGLAPGAFGAISHRLAGGIESRRGINMYALSHVKNCNVVKCEGIRGLFC